jgi:uncharacterized protein YggE
MTTRTITTDATARRETDPELATVEVTVTGDGEKASGARALARDRAATIHDSLSTVSADQIRTVDIQVEDATEPFTPDIDAQYQATERLHVECVPETAEPVVVEVTDAGGTVQTVTFQVHDQIRRQLQDEALAAAMERAREKASRLAAVEGLAVSDVKSITTREVSTGMDSIVEEALEGSPDTDLSPPPITVSEAVEVVYELTAE